MQNMMFSWSYHNTTLTIGTFTFKLDNVYLIPSMRKNLLSISQFCIDNNVLCAFDSHNFYIFDLKSHSLLFQGRCRDSLYRIPALSPRLKALSASHNSFSIWHHRLDHPSAQVLSRLGSNNALSPHFKFQSTFCKGGAFGKSTCLPFATSTEIKTDFPFALVHSDVWQSPVLSASGFKYYVLFSDDYTRYSWLYFMKNKSEVLHHFRNFISYVKNQFSTTIKQFQSDGGGEYVNRNFADLCSSLGINHRLSCPHTPAQNGLAEHKHRHIANIARTILSDSHVPLRHWPEAVSTAVYLINHLPLHKLQWSSP